MNRPFIKKTNSRNRGSTPPGPTDIGRTSPNSRVHIFLKYTWNIFPGVNYI
jgi:hypothetical protein